jgi:hypothetical protein
MRKGPVPWGYPAAPGLFWVLRGLWGKSELKVREVGKLAVAKRTNPHSLLPPCILYLAAFWPGYEVVACRPSAD